MSTEEIDALAEELRRAGTILATDTYTSDCELRQREILIREVAKIEASTGRLPG